MGSDVLPISVNRVLLVLFFTMTALTLAIKLSTSVQINKIAPDSFSAVVHHVCEASYMKPVWVKDEL